MSETLKLRHYGFGESKPDRDVRVEYVAKPHWNTGRTHRGRPLKAYEIWVDGEHVGEIDHSIENTDRKVGRLRSPGRGRLAWSWRNIQTGEHNGAGLYALTRRDAVARLLGYSEARLA